MFCTKCGAKIDGDAGFCSECGNPVTAYAGGSPMPGPVKDDKTEKVSFLQGPGKWLVLALAVLAVVVLVLVVFLVVKRSDSDRDRGRSETDIEQDREEEKEEEKEEDTGSDKALMGILQNISYYGDIEKCAMTAEQAAAYAQLIADGMAGKVKAPESAYGRAMSDVVYWDIPYKVDDNDFGAGFIYMTDRANVMLADFSGDGNPYLYVYSSLAEDSYEIYGWEENTVKLIDSHEGDIYKDIGYLFEDTDGKVKLLRQQSSGIGWDSMEIYSFSGGAAKESYSVEMEITRENIRCVENGVETIYNSDQEVYDSLYAEKIDIDRVSRQGHVHTMSGDCFYEMQPSPLSEMLDNLGQYAVTLGYDSSLLPSSGGEAAQAEPEQPAAVEEESPWLLTTENCMINVDLSACVPANCLEDVQQDTYGDTLLRVVNSIYKFPEILTITNAAFYEMTSTDIEIGYHIDNSDYEILFLSLNGGKWEAAGYLVNVKGSDYNDVPIIFDYGVPDNATDLYEECVRGNGSGYSFDGRIYRTDYKMGDPVMYLRDAGGNVIEIPVS